MAPRLPLWRLFYSLSLAVRDAVLEALFPTPPAEREVLAMNVGELFQKLPRAPSAPIGDACSVFAYKDERVSRLVWSIKYKKSAVGAALAGFALHKIVRQFYAALPVDMNIVVVPMPITRARRRERGFNQCELIMDEMRKLESVSTTDSHHFPRSIFARDLLIRVRHKSRQTKKNRSERLESVGDLFAVNEKVLKKFADLTQTNKEVTLSSFFVVVIDDVITTGSTIKDAIETLRRAGFVNTYGLSVAH